MVDWTRFDNSGRDWAAPPPGRSKIKPKSGEDFDFDDPGIDPGANPPAPPPMTVPPPNDYTTPPPNPDDIVGPPTTPNAPGADPGADPGANPPTGGLNGDFKYTPGQIEELLKQPDFFKMAGDLAKLFGVGLDALKPLLPLLLSVGGGLFAADKSKDISADLKAASQDANAQATGILDKASHEFDPWKVAGINALDQLKGNSSAFGTAPFLADRYKPIEAPADPLGGKLKGNMSLSALAKLR